MKGPAAGRRVDEPLPSESARLISVMRRAAEIAFVDAVHPGDQVPATSSRGEEELRRLLLKT